MIRSLLAALGLVVGLTIAAAAPADAHAVPWIPYQLKVAIGGTSCHVLVWQSGSTSVKVMHPYGCEAFTVLACPYHSDICKYVARSRTTSTKIANYQTVTLTLVYHPCYLDIGLKAASNGVYQKFRVFYTGTKWAITRLM